VLHQLDGDIAASLDQWDVNVFGRRLRVEVNESTVAGRNTETYCNGDCFLAATGNADLKKRRQCGPAW